MNKPSPLQPAPIKAADTRLQWGKLTGANTSLAIASCAANQSAPLLVITADANCASRLQRELNFFAPDLACYLLPDRETLPYDHFSPHADLVSERLRALYKLQQLKQGVVISALSTVLHHLIPPSYLGGHAFALTQGDKFNPEKIRSQLVECGYRLTEQVLEHGEFAIRGAIVDLFPMGSNTPFRIELFDDEVDTIRTFDPDNQRSIEKIRQINLLPAREFPLDDNSITFFRQQWRAKFSGNPMESAIYANISEGEAAAGVEYYLPFFFPKLATIFDYLPESSTLLFHGEMPLIAKQFWDEVNHRYEQLRYDIRRPLLEPSELFLTPDHFFQLAKPYCQIQLKPETLNEKPGRINFDTQANRNFLVNHKLKRPLAELEDFINEHTNTRFLFCAESTGRRETLLELLHSIGITPKIAEDWQHFLNSSHRFSIIVAPLDEGLQLPEPNIVLITESQLFGNQVMQRRLRKARQQDPNVMIRNLTELEIGSPVVHLDHGVGRYMGLTILTNNQTEAEFLTLEYAGGDKIYVPVASLHLISRYTGADAENAPLQRLGSKQWEKIKERTAKRVRDVAAELLKIYSEREASPGFAFKPTGPEFLSFRNAFPFEETPDQTHAINDVVSDMVATKSMDRLICGDVGFGKTEVAMQAAFLAVQSGKQVAVLVPTTLLATQHATNFKDRFADWPIRIAGLSRMCTPKESQQIIDELTTGKLDIVIGTHKLLSPSIQFQDLGLLIVDEEQRFGVRQKERIRAMRAHVDILTLTATPIPRTLNMALSGTRDLSVITTPPVRRLAVKTFVHEHSNQLIREAILRETMRGGQVYFLHNEVATIQATAERLQQIVPEARIIIAHGQMPERELERVMADFYHQRHNVLLASTIIESGIDIPTANTIIINRADRFGLAQLHQLRGRVGRSHHQAYAYLLTPPPKAMTRDAKKRLEAIAHLEDLGAGFHLATHDLEIRGAGEILGEEQSGHIESVGFSLYMDLLEQAVTALKNGEEPDIDAAHADNIEIDLSISSLLPETYIHDVHLRLTLYKRLANCKTNSEIDDFKAELIDRFGLLPDPAENLIQIAKLKLAARALGVEKIDNGKQYGHITFNEKPNVDPGKIIKLIQLKPKQFQLQGSNKLRFTALKTDEASGHITAQILEIFNQIHS